LELDWGKSKDKYQTFLVFSLIFLACILVYYFHFVLRTGIIITHFFYIPIILSGVWWKRKALWVPFFLAGILFLADWINPINKQPWVDDLFRSIVFISVSIITIILSEQIWTCCLNKSNKLIKTVFV
jgi:hypothetical protein